MSNIKTKNIKNGIQTAKRKDLIFYILMMAFPVVQFCVMYIGVNINAILLAFQEYDRSVDKFVFVGFKNITNFIQEFFSSYTLKKAALNSVIVWALSTIITLPLVLLFSFFIYKKMPLEGLFKFSLFLPSIISGIVTVVIYTYFVERAIPALWAMIFKEEIEGLLANPQSQFITVLFYNIFYSFGGYLLLFLGAMNNVDISTREAAKLDGADGFKEFYYIVLPEVYPTLTTFLVLSIAGVFTNQFSLFSFYGTAASTEIITFGYYLYSVTSVATEAEYPRLAAIGLILTIITVPATLLVKHYLEKAGPKEW